jgi:hypothetical protein
VAGAERTSVRYFEEAPLRGAGSGPGRDWTAYRPPASGTRILILSDLGTGGLPFDQIRSRAEEWRSFLALLRRAGCDPVAFVPYPPDRWPRWVTALPVVHWDRRTTVHAVTEQVTSR